jgi:4-amino-4-deoxychorismate lyase
MCLLFESIRIENRQFMHLSYHQERVDRSRRILFNVTERLDLSSIPVPEEVSSGVFKCRITYRHRIEKVEIISYKRKVIRRLKLIADNDLDYSYKFCDRSAIGKHLEKLSGDEDIILIKHGLITDSSFSNLAFFDGTKWVTPTIPLLKGTCRQRLLDEGRIIKDIITPSDLMNYSKVSLINAMTDLDELSLPSESIYW